MKKLTPVKQYLLGFGLILLALLVSVGAVFYLALKPKWNAEKAAVQAATDYASLTSTSSVDTYNGSETYYSVYGQTESGLEEVAAVGESGDIYIYRLSDGISSDDARTAAETKGATNISKVVFGIYEETPIWEVTADNGYYLVNFETGEFIKKEGL